MSVKFLKCNFPTHFLLTLASPHTYIYKYAVGTANMDTYALEGPAQACIQFPA